MSKTMLIRNGHVVDPSQSIDGVQDVLVRDGKIAEIGLNLSADSDAEVIDALGKIVAPGLIDTHVHFRDPGFEAKETLETGAQAAIAGGFTAVCCMPNTSPALDTPERVADIVTRSKNLPVTIYPVGTISVGRQGAELADLEGMAQAGAIGFSDDGDATRSSAVMRAAFEKARTLNRPIMVHAEDWTLSPDGVMNEGDVSRELGVQSIPRSAEEITTLRDIELARLTDGWLYVLHVSTSRGREMIRRARREGVNVTAEVMPHHLLLTDEWVAGRRRFVGDTATETGPTPDSNAKVNPPLRTEDDARDLLEGVIDGTFEIISTDHAPHAAGDKPDDLNKAASGMIGLEVALPLLLRLVRTGEISWSLLIERLATNPARILSLPGGTLRAGCSADIVIIDPDHEWTISEETIKSRSKNTPLLGMTVQGRAAMTIVGGEVRHRV